MDASQQLEPLPYHSEIVAYLQREERDLWNWFSSNRVRAEQADAVRLELLKTTYRIEPANAPKLHEIAHYVSAKLGSDGPITFYQSQRAKGLNASIAFVPEETHIILHGPIAEALSDAELEALLGHELSHRILLTKWEGQFLVADQILAALANDATARPANVESIRLFRLYTEIFCDRGGWHACGDVPAVVSLLVKIETGLKDVSGESYLRQADEIFSLGETKTSELTHPECFIRARALRLWKEQVAGAEVEIRRMIEGPASLTEIDLLGQVHLAKLTRRLIDQFLSYPWMRTEVVIAHARLFFEDYQLPTAIVVDTELVADMKSPDVQLQDYFCYVLLDFATTDRDLDDASLAAAILLADKFGLAKRFEPIARKELDVRKKQWEKIEAEAESVAAQASGGRQSPD